MGFMGDENRGAGGFEDGRGKPKRVGTAERDEAIALLDEHWRAGRLDPSEHEGRVVRAKSAVTQADLDVLFIDLPEPGPAPESTAAVSVGGPRGLLESKRDTIMALMPFLALALFFTTGYHWMWFLLVPVMGILLYGPDGGQKPRLGRHGGRGRDR
jgi:Domain of unknown function (DUF1707)